MDPELKYLIEDLIVVEDEIEIEQYFPSKMSPQIREQLDALYRRIDELQAKAPPKDSFFSLRIFFSFVCPMTKHALQIIMR